MAGNNFRSTLQAQLTLSDTNVLKGVALILLLIHHLFFEGNMPVDDLVVRNNSLVQTLGVWSKVCVAIFVFLSGYGLTVSADKSGGIGNVWYFYARRYLKLMINYWFIYLMFVPLGVFAFDRTFEVVYHGSHLRPLWDILGLHFAITGDEFGYNPTWWFYSCILILYALYPLFYKFRDLWFIVVPVALIYYFYGFRIPFLHAGSQYVPCFLAGIYLASHKSRKLFVGHKYSKLYNILMLAALILTCIQRFKCPNALWDVVIVTTLCATYMQTKVPSSLTVPLAYLGTHSFNIFLFHTFIFGFYFKTYIYWTTNPFLIFFTLLLFSLILSCLLEMLKKLLGVNALQQYLLKQIK